MLRSPATPVWMLKCPCVLVSEWASIEILCGALDRKCCVARVLSSSLGLSDYFLPQQYIL